ncbi:MAG: NADH-quinone oxidoreductase subunit A [Candidatus Odinarchaeia archaeon]
MFGLDPIIAAPISFVIILICVIILYLWGRKIAPPSRKIGEAVKPYACGEEQPEPQKQFRVNWLYYAIYYIIFDIAGFILAMSMFALGTLIGAVAVTIYGIVTLVAILTLLKG